MNIKSFITLFFLSFYTILTYPMMQYNSFTGKYDIPPTPEQIDDLNGALQTMSSGSREEKLSRFCLATGSMSTILAVGCGCLALSGGAGIGTAATLGGLAIVGCGCSYCISRETCTNTCRTVGHIYSCGQCCASPEEQRSLVRSQPGMS